MSAGIFDPEEFSQQVTPEQALNYVREKIEKVRAEIDKMPAPASDELFSTDKVTEYQHWHNRLLIIYGQAVGAVAAAQAFGHISIPEFQVLKRDLMGVMQRRSAAMIMKGE